MKKNLIPIICALFFIGQSCADLKQQEQSVDWPEITSQTKPWTRWWWMGSAVEVQNLELLMGDYAAHGFGGVEVTPIYGVKGEEANNIDFLSPRWVDLLTATVKAGQRFGMGVDMNTGTGWPFGGPQVTDVHASKQMEFRKLIDPTQDELDQFINKMNVSKEFELIALSAFNSHGERINLLNSGNTIEQIQKAGRKAIAILQSNTNQKVKRAAPGGEGLVFNHFSKVATQQYLDRFDQAFNGNPGIRCFFNDSYELDRANAERELFDTFEHIKGYDLALYASELSGEGNSDTIARIKADYRDVLGEMLLSNFTTTWTNWAAQYGAITRNQAHGSPGNLIDLYAAVGIPELETFHATGFPFLQSFIDQSGAKHTESNKLFKKFASSAAHQKGEPLVSCETFTWLNEHFKTPLYQCKPELDELFVKGVNHVFFHGTTYSPEFALWPGWCFYASVHMDPANPQWEHIKAMTTYISRCQSVLQQGQHTNDFLVLWSTDDYNADTKRLEKQLSLHNSQKWVNMPEITTLLDKGYLFDFTTDRIVQNSRVRGKSIETFDKVPYKAVVVPETKRIKLATFKKLLSIAKDGSTVIFRNLPSSVSGFLNYQEQEKEMRKLIKVIDFKSVNDIQRAVYGKGQILLGEIEPALSYAGIERETLVDHHIKFISRKTTNGYYYFIANHENEELNDWLSFKNCASQAILMNPIDGEITMAKSDEGKVKIHLKPGESGILYFSSKPINNVTERKDYIDGQSFILSQPWTMSPIIGGPSLFPTCKLPELKFWTDLEGEDYNNFSGTVAYETIFDLNKKNSDDYLLKLGEVEASVRVLVNGEQAGILWSFPFELEIGQYLKEGKNCLRFEVCNLGGNRIRYLDKKGIKWKKFENINIVNLDYKPFDASEWNVLPSGLNGDIKIIEQIVE